MSDYLTYKQAKRAIITITGPSCAGKSSLERFMCDDSEYFIKATSHTTRPKRESEKDGEDYYFVDKQYFDIMNRNNQLVESVEFNGSQYGVSGREIVRITSTAKIAVIVCDPNGRNQIESWAKKNDFEIVKIFLNADINLITERFLRRIGGDVALGKFNKDVYRDRLKSIMTLEREWVTESFSKGLYDINFLNFDADTQNELDIEIVQTLLDRGIWQLSPTI